jgi:hypothetical protein
MIGDSWRSSLSTGPARAIFAVALVYIATLALLERRGFWVVDNGNKFLLTKAIVINQLSDYSLPWPGLHVDPRFDFNPIPPPFGIVERKLSPAGTEKFELYSVFSPFFALLSAPFYRYFGFTGLYVIPFASSILALIGVAKIARFAAGDDTTALWAVLIVGLGTPMWFYSVVFWEHTPAVCLCVWSVYFFLRFFEARRRNDLLTGGALAAMSVYFRDELYVFCLALFLWLVFRLRSSGRALRSPVEAALCMLVFLAPLWLFQYKSIDQPFGHHLGTHLFSASGAIEHIKGRGAVFYRQFISAYPSMAKSVALTLPYVLLFLIRPAVTAGIGRVLALVCAAIGVATAGIYLAGFLNSGSVILHMYQSSNSLFLAAPIAIAGFYRIRGATTDDVTGRSSRFLGQIAVLYSILYGLAAPTLGAVGIHWGNRFLLVLYPFFGIMAAMNFRSGADGGVSPGKFSRSAFVLLFVSSLALQVYSIRLLAIKKDYSHRLNEEIMNRPEYVVIATAPEVPLEISRSFYSKMVFLVSSPQDLSRLGRQLAASGYREYLSVSPTRRFRGGPTSIRVDDGGLNFFSVKVTPNKIPSKG